MKTQYRMRKAFETSQQEQTGPRVTFRKSGEPGPGPAVLAVPAPGEIRGARRRWASELESSEYARVVGGEVRPPAYGWSVLDGSFHAHDIQAF